MNKLKVTNMKPNITKEDVIALREEFIKYTETAE